jgi:group II intron reverse transcriptase/maturase
MDPLEGKMTGAPIPEDISTRQLRIAERARQTRGSAIHTLSRFMDQEWLEEAFRRTRKDGSPGIDGMTSEEYGVNLQENLRDLLARAKSGSYRAPPVRRVHIPKGDGTKTRAIGIPTFEDKVLQRAVLMLLEPVYEESFEDFSYGFRRGRSAHDALKALNAHLFEMHGGWVLEVDIESFFDSLVHEKLRALLSERVTDGVVTQLIGKWLQAGVMTDGQWFRSETGSPQGGVISPLLANIYLHEALDAWWVRDVLPRMRGRAHLIRYADDFVMVFAEESDARRVHEVLPKRMERYGLRLHPEKTRLLDHRQPPRDGGGCKPGTFDFLGFTHYWGVSFPKRLWIPKRKTAGDRFRRSVAKIKAWLLTARHQPIRDQAHMLKLKLRGHDQYYGIVGNSASLSSFRHRVAALWRKSLARRSQRGSMSWAEFAEFLRRNPLAPARIIRSQSAG